MVLQPQLIQKQVQKLILSPQMQQALHLLQMPLLELRQLIQQELVQNPMLEELDGPDTDDGPAEPTQTTEQVSQAEQTRQDNESAKLEQLDSSWEEYLDAADAPSREPDADQEERSRYFESLVTRPPSLESHLLGQLALVTSTAVEREIGEAIIGNIDEDGYLKANLEEMAASLGREPSEVERVLRIIQSFEPLGVAARDLRECLLIQLAARGKQNSIDAKLVSEYLEELQKKRYPFIAKSLGLGIPAIQRAAQRITSLEPRPGRKFVRPLRQKGQREVSPDNPKYILPDVTVEQVDGEYRIAINDGGIPRLRLSPYYRDLMGREPGGNARQYLSDKMKSALWLIRSIEQRRETMYRVTECIVKQQRDFLEKGLSHLRPLKLREVAEMINMHESTVSRVTADKYVQTPRGIFELRYFFSGAVRRDNDEPTSVKTIKSRIKALIEAEDPKYPLKDQTIAEAFRGEGIRLARRTVAKYREQVGFLPSKLRRQY